MKSKRIHFNKLEKGTNAILILCALIFVSVGIFDLFPDLSQVWTKRISMLGYIFIVVHFWKIFIHPNYVGWNKHGMHIRIKTILGKRLSFKDIKSTDLENGVLKISKLDGKKIELDLNGIEAEDIERLN